MQLGTLDERGGGYISPYFFPVDVGILILDFLSHEEHFLGFCFYSAFTAVMSQAA